MRGVRATGRADVAALAAALLLVAGAAIPDLLLRAEHRDAPPAAPPDAVPTPPDVRTPFARCEAALAGIHDPPFRADPSRRIAPLGTGAVPGGVDPGASGEGDRVTDLQGRVASGRIALRWTPPPGSGGTVIHVEGLGGPGVLEKEVPAGVGALEIPLPGATGTAQVRATLSGDAAAPEVRTSIPYRIPVEVVGVARVNPELGTAFVRLRREYDGRIVEAEFALRLADVVGNLSSVGGEGEVIDFRTDLVLEEVRALRREGPRRSVPEFAPDGRVLRDAEGRPLLRIRADMVAAGFQVVLRGPDDRRRVFRAE